MQKLTKWIVTECGTGAYRAIECTDGKHIGNRIAFIEKTPRVRIREYHLGTDFHFNDAGDVVKEERRWPEHLDWCYGPKGDSHLDIESRKWCDRMLVAMGYTLEN